jgi:hypothetical protein
LASADPAAMLAHVRGTISDRRLRLFACAVCRSCWGLFTDERSRQAVEVAELYADGATSVAALHRAYQTVMPLLWIPHDTARERLAADAAVWACARELRLPANPGAMTWLALADLLPPADQAALLRDLVGNPWRALGLPACNRCDGGRVAIGADRPFVWSGPGTYPGPCPVCRGAGHAFSTPTVLSLARAAYEERGREAGCEKCQGPLKRRVDELMAGGPLGDGIGPRNASWHINQEFDTRLTPEEVHAIWQKRKPWFKGRCDCYIEDGFLDPERLAVLSDALEEAGCMEEAMLRHLRSPGPHARGCHAVDLLLGKE